MITIYVWKLKDGDKELLDKVMLATFGESKEVPKYNLVELENNTDKIKPIGDVVLCMGTRCHNLVSHEYPGAIKLPVLSDLEPRGENRESRLEAWETLTQAKNASKWTHLDLELELSPEDTGKLLTEKSKTLVRHVNEDMTEHWIGTTALGKKVLISNKQNTKNIPCNFQLTFEELYAAKLAFDLLGLKSLTLVKGNKDD